MNINAKFRAALDMYTTAFKEDVEKYATGKVPLSLPVMETEVLMALFERVQQLFKDEPTLLDVRSPCIVVGDIHGQILDLYRILHFFGMPITRKCRRNSSFSVSCSPASGQGLQVQFMLCLTTG